MSNSERPRPRDGLTSGVNLDDASGSAALPRDLPPQAPGGETTKQKVLRCLRALGSTKWFRGHASLNEFIIIGIDLLDKDDLTAGEISNIGRAVTVLGYGVIHGAYYVATKNLKIFRYKLESVEDCFLDLEQKLGSSQIEELFANLAAILGRCRCTSRTQSERQQAWMEYKVELQLLEKESHGFLTLIMNCDNVLQGIKNSINEQDEAYRKECTKVSWYLTKANFRFAIMASVTGLLCWQEIKCLKLEHKAIIAAVIIGVEGELYIKYRDSINIDDDLSRLSVKLSIFVRQHKHIQDSLDYEENNLRGELDAQLSLSLHQETFWSSFLGA